MSIKSIILVLWVLAGMYAFRKGPEYRGIRITYYKVISDNPLETVNKANDGYEYEFISDLKSSWFGKVSQIDPDGPPPPKVYGGVGRGNIYNNPGKHEKILEIYLRHLGGRYLIDKTEHPIQWEIDKSQTRKIAGYTCYKATGILNTGEGADGKPVYKRVTAWFTPQLPYPFGPGVFDGLPGIILAAGYGSSMFVAVEVHLLHKKPIVHRPEGEVLSYQEYLQRLSAYSKQHMGVDLVKRIREGVKKRKKEMQQEQNQN